jgi:hypothetical protein
MVASMEIISKNPLPFLLRLLFFFFLLLGIWSIFATSYANLKMLGLQAIIQLINPVNPPYIRPPGFMQGYAISELTFLALVLARWSKTNLMQWKRYPWILLVFMLLVLVTVDFGANLLEILGQHSRAFWINFTVTWLLSAGTIVLPFFAWIVLEARAKYRLKASS